MRRKTKHTIQAILLLVIMLPAISGIHVFHQFCHTCVEDVSSASVFSTFHEHHHDCDTNSCTTLSEEEKEHNCSCNDHCDENSTCQHEYKVMEFVSVHYSPVKLVIAQSEIPPYFQHNTCMACLETGSTQLAHFSFNTMLIHPEPDRWKENGVFLL